tara:strand:- start:987 stop:1205 length:219 start_codon:yes stop_codon:yes gene_type:complete
MINQEILKPIVDLIKTLSNKQIELSTEILKIRYENLELLKILKSSSVLNQDEIIKIYKKGEDYENSKIETRN